MALPINKEDLMSSDLDSARKKQDSGDDQPAVPDKTKVREINMDLEALLILNKRRDVRNNTVSTSKYTWWSFVPRNLFEQFTKKMANMYFLAIMFMQMITVISISNG